MTATNPQVNPQVPSIAVSTPTITSSSEACQRAAKLGGYGGLAVAAWLVTAVATGHGVAAADSTGTSSSDSSTSTSANTVSSGESSATSKSTTSKSKPAAGRTSKGASGNSSSVAAKDATKDGSPSLGSGRSWGKSTAKAKRSGKTSTAERSAPSDTISSDGVAQEVGADKVGTQEESTTHTGAAGPLTPAIDITSVSDAIRSKLLHLPSGQARSTVALPDLVSSHTGSSDTAASPAASVGPARISDTVKRSLEKVEQVTGKITDTVTEQLTEKITASNVAATANETTAAHESSVSKVQAATTAVTAPVVQNATPATAPVGVLNGIVTNLLNPFLAPSPNTPEPFTPVAWAVLGWVRRNLFNQSPTINYSPTTTVQTGQTVTGNIGAADAEGDALTYTVTQAPQHGTLTIDQATGNFTYTPDDINYDAAQTDSFTVSVSDGKVNLLSLFRPHSAQDSIDVTVLNPTIERVIVNLPDGITHPWTPRYAADGKSIYFTATPAGSNRSELYQINTDGTNAQCLTCGLSPDITKNLFKPVPTADGSGRVLIQVETGMAASAVIYEPGVDGAPGQLIPIIPPATGGYTYPVSPLQEPRISPDGQHILFSRLGAGQDGYFGVVPVVGKLVRQDDAYVIEDARVIAAAGEGKNWTPDGKGVVCLCGLNEAGNADNVMIDLATGEVTRLNGNLDYDEDMDLSPNEKWMAVGSMRGFDGLTPMSRIVRPSFLPTYIQGAVYTRYALPTNISNQEWLVAVEDDLKRENGIPLFEYNDGYTARSMPSFSPDGDAVVFWEYNIEDETQSRLVIANLKYTTSVGPVEGDRLTPELSESFPELDTYVLAPPPLPATGTYAGAGGGTAVVSETADPTRAGHTIRTVTYTDYVNEDGMILNGTESTSTTASQAVVYYQADITVTGAHTGYLRADATIDQLQRTITGDITSDVDGDVQHVLDQEKYEEAVRNT